MSRYQANSDRARCAETGKVCMSKGDARRAARTLNQRQQRDRWPVHEYLCLGCGCYHTGHVRTRQQNRRVERRAKPPRG